MKFLSVLVIAVFLSWTWNFIHSTPAISFETHAGIQEKLSRYIVDSVSQKRPQASHIRVDQIWTEPKGTEKVTAHFVYSFKEAGSSEQAANMSQIKGQADLKRESEQDPALDRWVITEIRTSSDAVTFEEGLAVVPGEDQPEPQQPEAPEASHEAPQTPGH